MWEIETVGKEDKNMFYANSAQEQAKIGHLRGDFGGGTEFYTTWWDKNDSLKTPHFKNEIDIIVNGLRKDVLKDLPSMLQFCYEHKEARIEGAYSPQYGFKVDTQQHSYYLRCNPQRGDYNFYLMCFQRDRLIEKTQPEQQRQQRKRHEPER